MMYFMLFAWAMCNVTRRRALPRSEARFRFATLTIITGLALEAIMAGRAVVMFQQHDHIIAGTWILPMAVLIPSIREAFNDRNWFNDQFKKLKSGLKNLSKKLSNVRLPSLTPAPNPI